MLRSIIQRLFTARSNQQLKRTRLNATRAVAATADVELLDSRTMLSAAAATFQFQAVASNLDLSKHLFNQPGNSPYTLVRGGSGSMSTISGFPKSLALAGGVPSKFTFAFGAQNPNQPTGLTLTSFDNGLQDGVAKQFFTKLAGNNNTLTILLSGKPVATGSLDSLTVMTTPNSVSTGVGSMTFTAAIGSDPTVFNELKSLTGGTGKYPFHLGSFSFQGDSAYGPDASLFKSSGSFNQQVAAPLITSAAATTFKAGTAASFTVKATGSPVPMFAETGTLPTGVTLSKAGVLTSTAATPAGTYTFRITVSNGIGAASSQDFVLIVKKAPAITSAATKTFVAGTAGKFQLVATGFPVPTFSETETVPIGVTLSKTGVITTTAATPPGTYKFTITASNGFGTAATQTFTLVIVKAPLITSVATTKFATGKVSTFTFTATGFPAPTFSETGTLPVGVTFTQAGVLSSNGKTPAGKYTITVTARNSVGSAAPQVFKLVVG